MPDKVATFGSKVIKVLLKDLSKAFDYLLQKLMVAKLNYSGFTVQALQSVWIYVENGQLRIKINHSYEQSNKVLLIGLFWVIKDVDALRRQYCLSQA